MKLRFSTPLSLPNSSLLVSDKWSQPETRWGASINIAERFWQTKYWSPWSLQWSHRSKECCNKREEWSLDRPLKNQRGADPDKPAADRGDQPEGGAGEAAGEVADWHAETTGGTNRA